MSFACGVRELRRDALSMLETHIVMSSLIFRLALILVSRLVLTLVLCLISLMDLTITHMVLICERTTLILDSLVTTHVLIVIVFCVGSIFSARGFHTHFDLRHLNGPHFPRRGSCPTRSNVDVLKTVKTSSGCMVKCCIPKIYLTNSSTHPSTSSRSI
jgi:hypothetical protein